MDLALPIVDRVYQWLLEGIGDGRWGARLPSERNLASEVKVARMTLGKALRRLEAEGCLERAGSSGRRIIVTNASAMARAKTRPWRIGFLVPMAREDEMESWLIDRQIITRCIVELGHTPFVVHLALSNEAPRLGRLAKLMDSANADAWIVIGAPRVVVEWLDGHRREPVLACGGPQLDLKRIATGGTQIRQALLELARELLVLGHRRIVFITPRIHRQPVLSPSFVDYQNVLREGGIQVGDYHLPDWEETPEGLGNLLESLFRLTPPTAIILFEDHYAAGVLGFLCRHQMTMPDDVSVGVIEDARSSAWLWPGKHLASLRRDDSDLIRNITRWIEDQTLGRHGERDYTANYKLVHGNTLGPVKVDSPKGRK
ncbi:MAG: GntR family transcriptional regulator [Luteolibacter sp.]